MDYVTSFAKAASIGAIGVAALLFGFGHSLSESPLSAPPKDGPKHTGTVNQDHYHTILSQLKPEWRQATDIEHCQARHLARLEQERALRFEWYGDGTVSGDDISNALLILLACQQNPGKAPALDKP